MQKKAWHGAERYKFRRTLYVASGINLYSYDQWILKSILLLWNKIKILILKNRMNYLENNWTQQEIEFPKTATVLGNCCVRTVQQSQQLRVELSTILNSQQLLRVELSTTQLNNWVVLRLFNSLNNWGNVIIWKHFRLSDHCLNHSRIHHWTIQMILAEILACSDGSPKHLHLRGRMSWICLSLKNLKRPRGHQ